jgi:hypothetical protein
MMGESSRPENVRRLLLALATELATGEATAREAISAADSI